MAPAESHEQTTGRLTLEEYSEGIERGTVATLARALTLIESTKNDDRALAEQLLTRLMPKTGQARRVGISGVPGVGKSTFIEALGLHLTQQGMRVAVLTIDPSSGVSGGSILGDKTRMPRLSAEPNAFIRPAPSSGSLGGVAHRTRECMLICEAAGYDVVLIETVGVGQSETMVADLVDCFVALMLPGAGDELQAVKRGLLELVDVIVVNKADGETQTAAKLAAEQYESTLRAIAGEQGEAGPPEVLTCSALQQEGIAPVWHAIADKIQQFKNSGALAEKRGQQNLRWMWEIVDHKLRVLTKHHTSVENLRSELEAEIVAGQIAPADAAEKIIDALGIRASE